LTYGNDPETLLDNKNILLKDVINIQVEYITCSELANQLITLLYLIIISTIFLFVPWTGFVIGEIAFSHLLFMFGKFKLWKGETQTAKRTLIGSILLGVALILLVTFGFIYSITFLSGYWWISSILGSISIGLTVSLIRMNIPDRQTKAILKITSRRGEHSIALRPDDVHEARQLIWKSRKDISKLGFINNPPTIIEESQFV